MAVDETVVNVRNGRPMYVWVAVNVDRPVSPHGSACTSPTHRDHE
jgi:hypothetical protein